METYTALRAFADSWMLVAMVLFLAGVAVRVLRPESRAAHEDSAALIFRNDDRPAAVTGAGAPAGEEGR